MTPALMLHPETKQRLAITKQALPHALLLTGEKGTGLATIAHSIATSDLQLFITPLDAKGDTDHETGTITVAAIRNLYEQTRAKALARRVIIIDNAERMSLGAQAAFLKLLEEPSPNTHFILTTHTPQSLLPTIRSRLQSLLIRPLTTEQTEAFLAQLGSTDQQTKRQLTYLANGLPAELWRLSNDPAYFKTRASIMSDTRTFLTGSLYEKIVVAHHYHQDRARAMQLIDSAITITRHSLRAKPQPSLVEQLARLLTTKENLEANYNVRLQLMAFVV